MQMEWLSRLGISMFGLGVCLTVLAVCLFEITYLVDRLMRGKGWSVLDIYLFKKKHFSHVFVQMC